MNQAGPRPKRAMGALAIRVYSCDYRGSPWIHTGQKRLVTRIMAKKKLYWRVMAKGFLFGLMQMF